MERRKFIRVAAAVAVMAGLPVAGYAKPQTRQIMTGVDSDDKPFNLKNYAGKTCLISFFTAGCNLCTHDLKLMREFYVDNRAKDFVLIGVNIDAKHDDFMEYAHLIGLTVPAEQRFPLIWRNAPEHQDNFGPITRQPTHFVLNKAQEQVFKREGTFQPADWDQLWTQL